MTAGSPSLHRKRFSGSARILSVPDCIPCAPDSQNALDADCRSAMASPAVPYLRKVGPRSDRDRLAIDGESSVERQDRASSSASAWMCSAAVTSIRSTRRGGHRGSDLRVRADPVAYILLAYHRWFHRRRRRAGIEELLLNGHHSVVHDVPHLRYASAVCGRAGAAAATAASGGHDRQVIA